MNQNFKKVVKGAKPGPLQTFYRIPFGCAMHLVSNSDVPAD